MSRLTFPVLVNKFVFHPNGRSSEGKKKQLTLLGTVDVRILLRLTITFAAEILIGARNRRDDVGLKHVHWLSTKPRIDVSVAGEGKKTHPSNAYMRSNVAKRRWWTHIKRQLTSLHSLSTGMSMIGFVVPEVVGAGQSGSARTRSRAAFRNVAVPPKRFAQ